MPEIPGYYFDSERGKWFKVQPNHLATPSIAYSADNVRQVKIEREQKVYPLQQSKRWRTSFNSEKQRRKLTEKANDLSLPRIARFQGKMTPNTYSAAMRIEDGGLRKFCSLRKIQGAAWAEQLESNGQYSPQERAYSAFVWDQSKQSFIYGGFSTFNLLRSMPTIEYFHNSQRRIFNVAPPNGSVSQITSMTLSSSRVVAATVDGGPYGPCVLAHRIPGPFDDVARIEADNRSIGMHIPAENETPFCCSAVPNMHSQAQFVIGTNEKLELAELLNDGTWRNVAQNIRVRTGREVVNRDLAWVNPFTVAAGQSTGFVKLWDVRGLTTAMSVRHNEPIEKVRCCEGNMFVVQGQGGTVSLYDTRMATGATARRAAPRHHVIDYTAPTCFRSTGLDIHYDFGLVALSRWQRGTFNIQIHALRTGELLKTIKLSQSAGGQSGEIFWRKPDYGYGPTELAFMDGKEGVELACLSPQEVTWYI